MQSCTQQCSPEFAYYVCWLFVMLIVICMRSKQAQTKRRTKEEEATNAWIKLRRRKQKIVSDFFLTELKMEKNNVFYAYANVVNNGRGDKRTQRKNVCQCILHSMRIVV